MAKFRFMDFDIWKESIVLNDILFDFADMLIDKKQYRVAEQLRGASLSISNNIAEGSGSNSDKDFAHFLIISRRSTFEVVNILTVMHRRNYISDDKLNELLNRLDLLSRKITNFRKVLLK